MKLIKNLKKEFFCPLSPTPLNFSKKLALCQYLCYNNQHSSFSLMSQFLQKKGVFTMKNKVNTFIEHLIQKLFERNRKLVFLLVAYSLPLAIAIVICFPLALFFQSNFLLCISFLLIFCNYYLDKFFKNQKLCYPKVNNYRRLLKKFLVNQKDIHLLINIIITSFGFIFFEMMMISFIPQLLSNLGICKFLITEIAAFIVFEVVWIFIDEANLELSRRKK